METGVNEKTSNYLEARISNLSSYERNVVLIVDEIYTAQRVEYSSGKLHGIDDGQVTKTLLCFMVSSVAGPYQDVVCLVPVVNLTSKTLHKYFDSVLQIATNAGLNVVGVSMDNYSANKSFIASPVDKNKPLFLLFDTVHNCKNIYNNFLAKKQFICPPIMDITIGNPKFCHIERVYLMELGKPLKIAHRLTEKVLHPTSIEKTNVKLADAVFHESTINALQYYGENGYPEFLQTANFMRAVRKMWNITNVKTVYAGQAKRDDTRQPVADVTDDKLEYLLHFASWVKDWSSKTVSSLSSQTSTAVQQTCTSLVGLARHMLIHNQFSYVLLGQFQSDAIEKRFGWYRQLSGANYFVSVRQVLEAEKSIRIKSLIKLSNMNVTDATSVMTLSDELENPFSSEAEEMLSILNSDDLLKECNSSADKNILFYVAGFIARSVSKESNCSECKDLCVSQENQLQIDFLEMDNCEEDDAHSRKYLLEQVNRGGLCTPTELIYRSCLYNWNFYRTLSAQGSFLDEVYKSRNSKATYVHMATSLMAEGELSSQILKEHCSCNHSFETVFPKICYKMFNLMTRNYTFRINDSIRKKNRLSSGSKLSIQTRKISKLTSQTNSQ